MYELLKKRTIIYLISCLVFLLCCFLYFENHKNNEQQLNVEIYSIECCPLCIQVKKSLPIKLKGEFGDLVNIEVIDVDDKNNEQKYKQLVNSIDNFSDEHLNRFPVINVKNYFIIIGYNYYYDDEIINDIKRMNKNSHLGKKLEKSRYIWRKQNDNQ